MSIAQSEGLVTSDMQWKRALIAGGIVGAALTLEHLLCYNEEDFRREPELVLLGSNILGTATIAAGVALAAPSPEEAVRHITIAATGGTIVLTLRIMRRMLRQYRVLHFDAGLGTGEIRGARRYGQSYGNAESATGRN